jgi:hypothetical protein
MAIAAYASLASVAPGGAIDIHVDNTPSGADTTVKMTVTRLGAEAPEGVSAAFPAGHYPTPRDASTAGCGWPRATTLAVPASWRSGVYTATLANASGDTMDVVFVVRARVPGESSRVLLCYPTTTFQAYNDWGGKSLYGDGDRARKVSFDRPGGMGPGQTEPLVRWLAKKGIAVEVCTSHDLHADAGLLGHYQLFVSAGHDEYWTREMRDHVHAFVIDGGNAAFLSGNVSFWQARFEDGGRTLVCYRDAVEDPLAGVDDSRVTVQWASPPVNRPENTMAGVGFSRGAGSWAPGERWKTAQYRVNFPEHWVFEGTGLALGDAFAEGGVGYETCAADISFVDGIARATGRDGTPPTFVVLAVADLRDWDDQGQGGWATMGVFRSTGTVFTASSTNWADPIDRSPVVARITENVIARLSRRYPDHDWESAGTAPAVVSMSPGAGGLVAIDRSGALLWREASGQNLPWKPMGRVRTGRAIARAGRMVGRPRGAAGLPEGLLLGPHEGALWWRGPALAEAAWRRVGAAPDVITMASTEGYVFAATREGRLVARPSDEGDAPWQDIGSAAGIVAMTSVNRALFAVTARGELVWRQPVLEDAPWTFMACAAGVVAIAGAGGRIFGATRDGALLVRDSYP